MELHLIDARIFEAMITRVEHLAQKFKVFAGAGKDCGLKQWMDNQDACMYLRIKPRTPQTLRDNGTIAFNQIGRKMFYKPKDVKKVAEHIQHNKRYQVEKK